MSIGGPAHCNARRPDPSVIAYADPPAVIVEIVRAIDIWTDIRIRSRARQVLVATLIPAVPIVLLNLTDESIFGLGDSAPGHHGATALQAFATFRSKDL